MNTSVEISIARYCLPCVLIIIGLASSAFLPAAQAVLDPPPDGGYPGYNTAEGDGALFNLGAGASANTAVGFSALYNDSSDNNTAVGWKALTSDTMGSDNTAVGSAASDNINGSQNTAVGSSALFGGINAAASNNTAVGFQSLYSISTGYGNVANGWQALYSNRTGIYNTATGAEALYSNDANANNVTDFNTATGGRALYTNLSGTSNTATGYLALYYNKSGSYNTAEGINALANNTTGSNNVAIGRDAGANVTSGSNNIVIGANVLGKAGDANKITIGKQGTQTATYIAGISGKTVASTSAVAVFVDNTGKLGTVKSSARFKDEIKPMDQASEALLKLEPVTFRYKKELDPDGVRQFGLIAEQVEKVDPNLVVRDEEGKVSTVRYEAVNAMLLNEFLKEHQKVEEQQATIARQQKEFESKFAQQQQEIKALRSAVQKVTDAVALSHAAPHSLTAER